MPVYEVFWKKEFDGRASDGVFLDLDYQWAGEQEASSVKQLQQLIATTKQEDSRLENHRALRAGDVIRQKGTDNAWTLTSVGIWSQVYAFEDKPPSTT